MVLARDFRIDRVSLFEVLFITSCNLAKEESHQSIEENVYVCGRVRSSEKIEKILKISGRFHTFQLSHLCSSPSEPKLECPIRWRHFAIVYEALDWVIFFHWSREVSSV